MAKLRCVFGATILTPVVVFLMMAAFAIGAGCIIGIALGAVYICNKFSFLPLFFSVVSAAPLVMMVWTELYKKCLSASGQIDATQTNRA